MLLTTQYLPISQPPLIFLTVLLIILFAPIIMGRLRIPHIIGLVLAGVLIGLTASMCWSATRRSASSVSWVSSTSCSSPVWRWTWRAFGAAEGGCCFLAC